MAAACRTLPCVHTAQVKALLIWAVTATLRTLLHSLKHHFHTGFTYPSLQCRCPRQVATLSVRRVSRYQILSGQLSSQLKPLLMPCNGEVWRSTRLVTHTAANPMSGNVARRHWKQCRRITDEAQSCFCLLQSAYHTTSSACSWSGNPSVSHQFDRIAMARPAVTSNLTSRLGLSIPSAGLSALTPTPLPAVAKPPRSRNIET